MPKRVAVNSVFVVRDGKQVRIEPGKAFDFTAEELADIKLNSPDAVRTVASPEMTAEEVVQADAEATARAEADRIKAEADKAKDKAAADKASAAAKATPAAKGGKVSDASEI